MDSAVNKLDSRALSERLATFLKAGGPVVDAITKLASIAARRSWQALLFGGALRDVYLGRPSEIRDVDIVVSDPSLVGLRAAYREYIVKSTRFGGYRLSICGVHADVWPLSRTWAFEKRLVPGSAVSRLSATTFLNIEGATASVTAKDGRAAVTIVDAKSLFDSVRSRTLEINLEENPFPDLCITRSLMMALDTGFQLGPRLTKYIARTADTVSVERLLELQLSRYGSIRMNESDLRDAFKNASQCAQKGMPMAVTSLGVTPQRSRRGTA